MATCIVDAENFRKICLSEFEKEKTKFQYAPVKH